MISAIKEFIKFNKSLIAVSAIPNISKPVLKNAEKYQEGLLYLIYCGFDVDEKVIEEVKKLSIETPMDFKESCYYYANTIEK